jgi:hypothetical protein
MARHTKYALRSGEWRSGMTGLFCCLAAEKRRDIRFNKWPATSDTAHGVYLLHSLRAAVFLCSEHRGRDRRA